MSFDPDLPSDSNCHSHIQLVNNPWRESLNIRNNCITDPHWCSATNYTLLFTCSHVLVHEHTKRTLLITIAAVHVYNKWLCSLHTNRVGITSVSTFFYERRRSHCPPNISQHAEMKTK